MKRKNVYEIITDRIIERLEQGVVPWRKPFQSGGAVSWVSQKAYRGINTMLLDDGEYATFNQIKKAGGKVKKGEKSHIVVFWKMREIEDEETEEIKNIPFARYYRVFEINTQVEGLESKRKYKEYDHDPIEKAEEIKENYMGKPSFSYKPVGAWYKPSQDHINVPPIKEFKSAESFYSVLFHEMVHSTGHKSRLNREGIIGNINFGSPTYSREELVAEVGASMLCGVAGIENSTIDNSASYIQSWINVLKGDSRLIVSASQQAQRAVDHILGVKFNN